MLRQFSRRLMPFGGVVALCFVSRFVLSAPGDPSNPTFAPPELSTANAATSDTPQAVASPNQAPAAITEQSYIGTNQCFVCHRPQPMRGRRRGTLTRLQIFQKSTVTMLRVSSAMSPVLANRGAMLSVLTRTS
jgi:hypothetical protein